MEGKKSSCECCRTWEEELYWKHFNSIHFCLMLPNNFHDHLVLPEKFSAHMTTQLPDKVSLIGPSGIVWDMELQKAENLLLVGDGWKEFVKAYELKENSLLMFKYKRKSSFKVLIFDQESSCEKEAAYFVKKCRHANAENENLKMRIVREDSSTEVIEDDNENENSAFVVSKKSKKDVEGEVIFLRQENTQDPMNHTSNPAPRGRGRSRKMVVPCNSQSTSKAQSIEKPCRNDASQEQSPISLRDLSPLENGETSPDKEHFDKIKDLSGYYPNGNDLSQEPSPTSGGDLSDMKHSDKLKFVSGFSGEDGTATEINQISSWELITLDYREGSPAADYSHEPRLKRGRPKKQAVPRSSRERVSRSGLAGKRYTNERMSNRRPVTEMEKKNALQRAKQEQTENSFIVVMRPTCVYKRFFLSIPAEWMNKHLTLQHQEIVLRIGDKTWVTTFYYHSNRGVGGICPGWKKFAFDNSLEEFDVLLFKLANQKTVVFDVEIFRVIPEVLPPLLMGSSFWHEDLV